MNINASHHDDGDHDAFVEGALKAADFAGRNRTALIVAVVALIALVVGFFAWRQAREADKADAAILLNRGFQQFDAGDYAQARPWLEKVIAGFDGTEAAGEAAFLLGAMALQEGNFGEAETRFNEVLHAELGNGFMPAAAHAGLGQCLEQKQDFAGAAKAYATAGLSFPDNFNAPAHLLAAALCYERAGQPAEAKPLLEQIIDKHEKSAEKTRAEQILKRIEFALQ